MLKKIKLYLCDNARLYTLPELKNEYRALIMSGDLDPVDDPFKDWLFDATGKNGSLTVIYAGAGIDESLSENETLYIDRESDSITTKTWLKELYCDELKDSNNMDDMTFNEWIDYTFCWAVDDNDNDHILNYLLEELRK